MWELLCGKKLFQGESDLAVLKQIEACQTHVKPPSTINPKVPKELDYIVLKALAKQREKRYQSGEELQRALHKFLYGFLPDFNPSDLAYYAKDMFKNEIVEDRKRIQRLNEKVEQLLLIEIPELPVLSDAEASGGNRKEDNTTTMVDPNRGKGIAEVAMPVLPKGTKEAKVELEANPYKNASTPRSRPGSHTSSMNVGTQGSAQSRSSGSSQMQAPPQRIQAAKSGGVGKPIALAAAAVLALSVIGPDLGVKVPILSDIMGEFLAGGEARVELKGSEKGVVVTVNGQTVANSLPATLKDLPVGTPIHVAVSGSNGTFQQDVTVKKGEKKVIQVAYMSSAVSAIAAGANSPTQVEPGKSILLRLNLTPGGGGATISVNGRPVDGSNPMLVVPLDAPLELSADRSGYRPFKREFVLESRQMNGLKEWLMDVSMEPVQFGFLTVHTTPSADATILLDGKPWVKKTPIENEKLPVGTYNIRLSNEVLGMEKTITVQVQEGKSVTKDERLDLMREPASGN